MSRNSQKFNPPKNNEEQEIPKNTAAEKKNDINSLFGLSFVSPTEDVSLPTRGMHYPKSSPLHGCETVELRHMTAKEEDILSAKQGTDSEYKVYDKLIDSLLVDKNLNSSMFLEEDKLALLLSARISGYGEQYPVEVYCGNCKKQTRHNFDLSLSSVREANSNSEYDPDSNVYVVELPKSKITVKLGSDTDKIQEAVDLEKKQKQKYNLAFNETVSYLSKIIVSANDVSDQSQISKLAEILPALDAKYIMEFFTSARPQVSTIQQVKCDVCGTQTEREAPLTWAFFRTEF